jgi:hypothetical protein
MFDKVWDVTSFKGIYREKVKKKFGAYGLISNQRFSDTHEIIIIGTVFISEHNQLLYTN